MGIIMKSLFWQFKFHVEHVILSAKMLGSVSDHSDQVIFWVFEAASFVFLGSFGTTSGRCRFESRGLLEKVNLQLKHSKKNCSFEQSHSADQSLGCFRSRVLTPNFFWSYGRNCIFEKDSHLSTERVHRKPKLEIQKITFQTFRF